CSAAPVVNPHEVVTKSEEEMLFLQVSDVHITDRDNRIPTGGGKSGYAQLEAIAKRLGEMNRSVPLIIVSGDIVDNGTEKEWARAMPLLRQLRNESRVVLAPGNHDILPSYSPAGLFGAVIHPAGTGPF